MASTASPLRTVPSGTAPRGAASISQPVSQSAPLPVPAAWSRAGTGDLRRGNHPAGRALRRPVDGGAGEHLAPVVPLRPASGVVVPLRPGRAVGAAGAAGAGPVGAAPVEAAPAAAAEVGAVGRPVRVRLTRRGRVVLGGLGLVAALGVAAVVAPALSGSADPALELAGRSSVVVHSGDTLWSIAETVAPDADPRGVVDALREANGLEGVDLVPGQVLVLP